MALKKSELYSSLWQSCDELRGGMDASQYKDYVLVLLFIKYVSDKYAGQPFAPITIPKGAGFADMAALKGRADIGDQINKKIISPLANANKLSDMPDFNDANKLGDGKEKVDRLTNLIAIFENPALDFSKNRADGDDILGDACEYLMRHFATESGKSKGQFYTPSEVSRIMARIPACIIVLDKEHAHTRKGIFMIDASKGFIKDGPKNLLREQDIHRIVDTFNRQVEIPGYSRMVPVAEISDTKNDFNLNLPRYIDSTDAEDIQDITAHLRGGIPDRDVDAFAHYWKVIPGVRAALFKKDRYAGYCQLRVAATAIKATIFDHPEFTTFNASATRLLAKWAGNAKPQLGAKGPSWGSALPGALPAKTPRKSPSCKPTSI
jgi:type I restriction enzyme M protein